MTTPTATRATCARCGELALHYPDTGWEHDLLPGPDHACFLQRPDITAGHQPPDGPMVPGGVDLVDECALLGRHGEPCLQRLRDGGNLPRDLCPACRRTFGELLDSVLEPGPYVADDGRTYRLDGAR